MKNRFALSAACLLAAAVFFSPATANAQCTTATLSGVYGFNRVGVLINSPLPQYSLTIGPFGIAIFASVGQFTADGFGHLTSITQTISVNGTVYRNDQATGVYSINSDCTGTLTLRSSILPTGLNYDFVFESNNTVLKFVSGDQSVEALGKAIYEGPVAVCAGNSAISGAFGEQSFGVFFKTTAGLFITATEGRFAFDGLGGLTYAHTTLDVNLATFRWASSNGGKYSVAPNCLGTLTIPGSVFPNSDFVVVNGPAGQELLFINTDNSLTAALGEMTHQ